MVEMQIKITSIIAYILILLIALQLFIKNWKNCLKGIISLTKLTTIKDLNRLQVILDETILSLSKGEIKNFNLLDDETQNSYYDLAKYLVSNLRKYGADIKNSLIYLRNQIISELEFEDQIKSDYLRGFFQFLMIALFSWVFFFFSVVSVESKIHYPTIYLIGLMQLSGFVLHHFTFIFQKESIFSNINKIISSLMLTATLGGAGIDKNSVLALFGAYQKSSFKKETKVYALAIRFENAIYSWGESSNASISIFNELVSESFSIKRQIFKGFTQFMGRIRFAILTVFFLGSYFAQIFSFISRFLIE